MPSEASQRGLFRLAFIALSAHLDRRSGAAFERLTAVCDVGCAGAPTAGGRRSGLPCPMRKNADGDFRNQGDHDLCLHSVEPTVPHIGAAEAAGHLPSHRERQVQRSG